MDGNPENPGGGSDEFPTPGDPFMTKGSEVSPKKEAPQQPVVEPDKGAMSRWQERLIQAVKPKSSTQVVASSEGDNREIAGPSQDVVDTQKRVQEGQERIQSKRKAF